MKKAIFIFSLAGLLFAGYLSAFKFFSQTCAFGESCPYFLGYPACYFGLAMYVLLSVFSGMWNFGKLGDKKAQNLILAVSFLGIIFAGNFTLKELPLLMSQGFSAYFFGLPTCALGLIFYVAIFVLAGIARLRQKSPAAQTL